MGFRTLAAARNLRDVVNDAWFDGIPAVGPRRNRDRLRVHGGSRICIGAQRLVTRIAHYGVACPDGSVPGRIDVPASRRYVGYHGLGIDDRRRDRGLVDSFPTANPGRLDPHHFSRWAIRKR